MSKENSDIIDVGPEDVIFLGKGKSAVCYYRCYLPAHYLGMDWAGIDPALNMHTGSVKKPGHLSQVIDQYKVVIWQQPQSDNEIDIIKRLRANGTTVLIEVDDYLDGVRKMKDHDFKDAPAFSYSEIMKFHQTLKNCDGIIASTDFIAEKYGFYNDNVWVCKNGLDLGRYDRTAPDHGSINIGWSGATGHIKAFEPLLEVVQGVLEDYPHTTFITVGQSFASVFDKKYNGRVLSLPFGFIDVYTNPMAMFDISLAPSRDTDWYRAKSALRYYESAALAKPTIGDPLVYGEIKHAETGFHASNPSEYDKYLRLLIEDDEQRHLMGQRARAEAFREFDMFNRRHQWVTAIDKAVSDKPSKTIENIKG